MTRNRAPMPDGSGWHTPSDSPAVVLTAAVLDALPVGTVLNVPAHFGPDAPPVGIAVEKVSASKWASRSRRGFDGSRLVGLIAREMRRRGQA